MARRSAVPERQARPSEHAALPRPFDRAFDVAPRDATVRAAALDRRQVDAVLLGHAQHHRRVEALRSRTVAGRRWFLFLTVPDNTTTRRLVIAERERRRGSRGGLGAGALRGRAL